MEFHSGYATRKQAITDLFTATFSASEGAKEGKLIGALVCDLMETTPSKDLYVWSAYDDNVFLGCILLSRLTYAQDNKTVFILSPVAVKTDHQKTGIGQKLISFGIEDLRQKDVDFVVTYGDPNYYSKTGFRQITQEVAQAPFRLSMPEGWLGQSLSSRNELPLIGPSRCVQALNKPVYW